MKESAFNTQSARQDKYTIRTPDHVSKLDASLALIGMERLAALLRIMSNVLTKHTGMATTVLAMSKAVLKEHNGMETIVLLHRRTVAKELTGLEVHVYRFHLNVQDS